MSTIGIIPARGGSKRLPGKNILACAGKPLIAYTCEAGLNAKCIDRLIVSTDCEKISAVAEDCGAEVPYMRPPDLADDAAPTLPVLQHAIEFLEAQGERPENIVLLQATSPLRTSEHIDAAFKQFVATNAQSVVSVLPTLPLKTMRMTDRGLKPFVPPDVRENGEDESTVGYVRNGPAIVITKAEVIKSGQLYGEPNMPFVMSPETSVDIDTDVDFQIAEFLLMKRAQDAGL